MNPEEIKAIVRELQELHEEVRHHVGPPGPRLEICNRLEALAHRVAQLDETPR